MTRTIGPLLDPHGSTQLDRAIAGVLLAADAVWLVTLLARGDLAVGTAVALAIVAGAAAFAFLLRRSRPLLLAGLVVAGYVAAGAVRDRGLISQSTGAQAVLAVYALGSWGARRRWSGAVPAAFAAVALVGALADGRGAVEAVTLPVALLGAPWFAGSAARLRRQHLADVEHRLARAEAERDERARLAVVEERARIARDLHDVVAHHVSLIGVQAGAARTTLGHDSMRTSDALQSIESSSREAVREMRQLLDVLGADPHAAPPPPAPGLAEFGRLCDSYRAAGLTVRRTTSGTLEDVPPLHALSLYRIAEEALTNVARHSAAGECTLHLHGDASGARVVVADPGPPRPRAPIPPPDAGRGTVGIRERVEMFGGTVAIGPIQGSSWVVDAWLPAVRP